MLTRMPFRSNDVTLELTSDDVKPERDIAIELRWFNPNTSRKLGGAKLVHYYSIVVRVSWK